MPMHGIAFRFISCFLLFHLISANDENITKYEHFEWINGTFADDFIWAAATAAYQIEGAWDANGKGPSVWDEICHRDPNPIFEQETGDVACDSYHKWEEDIELMANLSLTHYRFSISWPRVLPTGFESDGVNEAGVTMYHWDLPETMNKMDGWLNSSSTTWFLQYADFLFRTFGMYVPYWITFNEPWTFAVMGFNVLFPTDCGGTCPYINTYNVIKSHALAYRRYETKYKSKQNGQVGITLNAAFSFPGTEKPEDVLATEKGMQFILGLYSNPIFGNGDWPEIVKTTVANRSKAEGFTLSRLPEFTADEKIKISGSFDFFGLNVYTATVTYGVPDSFCYTTKENASYYAEICVDSKAREQWPKAGSDWLRYTPFAPRGLLKWIKDHYGDVPVIITETGWSDLNGYTDDPWRSKFYTNYINSALQAYKLDKCNLKGFTAWSLMDNFEWLKGYSERFGLHYVNFSDPRRPRIPKQSAFAYGEIAKNNGFPDLTKPSTTTPSAANAVVDGSVSRNIFLSFVVIANVRHF